MSRFQAALSIDFHASNRAEKPTTPDDLHRRPNPPTQTTKQLFARQHTQLPTSHTQKQPEKSSLRSKAKLQN